MPRRRSRTGASAIVMPCRRSRIGASASASPRRRRTRTDEGAASSSISRSQASSTVAITRRFSGSKVCSQSSSWPPRSARRGLGRSSSRRPRSSRARGSRRRASLRRTSCRSTTRRMISGRSRLLSRMAWATVRPRICTLGSLMSRMVRSSASFCLASSRMRSRSAAAGPVMDPLRSRKPAATAALTLSRSAGARERRPSLMTFSVATSWSSGLSRSWRADSCPTLAVSPEPDGGEG
mmetsp:Transcript_42403/g.125792  ORF Transcript_42403/g.125792 Transcript_42403/m.125792 type:complete len:237 (+) Transcript_42403:520-1230(+)